MAAGRLDENKNHAMLIHAFAKIADEYPLMRLVIYGEGALRAKLEALVAEKGLSDRIEMPGSVSDVADRICKARIFTLTSNTEGMPNAIMEAMALGIPVIATDCPCVTGGADSGWRERAAGTGRRCVCARGCIPENSRGRGF